MPGKTENISIRCIVGRMLEHARVYMFGTERDTVYLSSADMMTRNTEHRVEIAYPLLEPETRAQVAADIQVQLDDNVKARILGSDGSYSRVPVEAGEALVNSQLFFMRRAIKAADELNSRLAKEERRARLRPIPAGPAPSASGAQEFADVPVEEALPDEQPPVAGEKAEQAAASEPKTIGAVQPAVVELVEEQLEQEGMAQGEAVQAVSDAPDAVGTSPAPAATAEAQTATQPAATEPVSVEATTLPPKGDDSPGKAPDMDRSLALMVKQNGRRATGWALIKMGFAILLGKKPGK